MKNQLASGHPPDDIDTIVPTKFRIEDLGDLLRIPKRSRRLFPHIKAEKGFRGICKRLEKIIIYGHVQRSLEWSFVYDDVPDFFYIRFIHDSLAILDSRKRTD